MYAQNVLTNPNISRIVDFGRSNEEDEQLIYHSVYRYLVNEFLICVVSFIMLGSSV